MHESLRSLGQKFKTHTHFIAFAIDLNIDIHTQKQIQFHDT